MKDSRRLIETFSIDRIYLSHDKQGLAPDYRVNCTKGLSSSSIIIKLKKKIIYSWKLLKLLFYYTTIFTYLWKRVKVNVSKNSFLELANSSGSSFSFPKNLVRITSLWSGRSTTTHKAYHQTGANIWEIR